VANINNTNVPDTVQELMISFKLTIILVCNFIIEEIINNNSLVRTTSCVLHNVHTIHKPMDYTVLYVTDTDTSLTDYHGLICCLVICVYVCLKIVNVQVMIIQTYL